MEYVIESTGLFVEAEKVRARESVGSLKKVPRKPLKTLDRYRTSMKLMNHELILHLISGLSTIF